ncbi:uncharacterized protein EV420DRAFT_1583665 [Desarmillaria tabescens]|uniref:F-box domain-containing protein n=1 Tax=Armillaria tabescens TaxID=1929756 RepID=A0AA39JCI5_ARMTA|nr:uncharacterized protein EV420DRAFT_1583665 [Desarmillaria tabescens]KAK0439527.1 hypothetical protein EV420DRAFT_1583665 [Desarmillaria tabescens]
MMFSSLPFELLRKIASLLSLEENKNLRLTSKNLCRLATPLVFQTVSLYLNDDRHYQRCMSLLEALGTPSYLTQHIKTLFIDGSFNPPYGKGGFWDKIMNRRRRAICLIEKRLLRAMPSLASLKSLYFSGFYPGELSPDSVNAIMLALSNLPLLSLLDINFHRGRTSYLDFHDLDSITFTVGEHMLHVVPSLVARSPNLTRLRLVCSKQEGVVPALSVFSGIHKGKLSRVEQLTLEGALILPTHDVPIIVPHLRHLTSLRILITDVAEEFWSALRIEMIHLEDVSVDIVNDALLEYLGSYSGSRSMMLITRQEDDNGSSQFWNSILPRHADTLVELYVLPDHAGGWCLDNKSLNYIRLCKRLEILRVKVDQETLDVKDGTNIIVGTNVQIHV